MADPNQPTNLNQAITPVGTCTSMCPEFERVERIVQKMVDKSEKVCDVLSGTPRLAKKRILTCLVSPPFDQLFTEHGVKDAEALPEICCWV